MNSILLNGKMRVENQIKARVYAQKPQLKCRLRIPSQAKQHQQLYRWAVSLCLIYVSITPTCGVRLKNKENDASLA